ncbi:M23 family metallopeptidase [Blastococcus sp. BMG 814]|uniref:M23 family metallopeptidase n=1 Tax=Blastococcus carthaginiensis TaxID=3050034 RepID=A0ABT9I9M1_9ACTN|nr:M23 family metallopeptidase [Blastococcus carthaginiensis]MDP5182270.1 M23 family metallopeptidase [Blastococcus carthaginiensis]
MSSLHHDRLPEGGAAPTGTVDATPAPARAASGTIEEKAGSTVPPQRQGKARGAGARRTTAPTTRTRSRAAGATAKGATPSAGSTPLTSARAAVLQVIAAKVAAAAAAEVPVRRRPTPYKRPTVDLAALAPVTDVAALAEAQAPAPAAVVVVKDVEEEPSPAAPVEPVVVVLDAAVAPEAEPAQVVAAVAAGRRGWLDRRPSAGRRRSALYLAAALVGALSISGASVSGATEVATETAGHSISVAEQLGIDASTAAPQVDEDDTSRLREMVASRNARDADRTAAADAQAEADRIAQEEADRAAAEAARPKAVLPVEGGRLTSGFGARWGTLHAGIDLAAPMRTPEYAVMDGVVLEAGPASGYGLAVYIQHGNGDVTVYGHMDEILVTPGQVVRAGDTIALLGNRGQSTGPHLHFEVHVGGIDGERIDPLPWLRERGVQI